MKVLVACEESQEVSKAFRWWGAEAYSCDLLPCSGGHPEWHIQGDVTHLIKKKWDLVISFPPCTDLSLSGAKWFDRKRLSGEQEQSIWFFLHIWRYSNCTENPMNIMSGWAYLKKWFPHIVEWMQDYGFPRSPSQVIQPYMFGEPFTKTTCLWLKNVPDLQSTKIVDKGVRSVTKSGKSMPAWYNLPPSMERGKLRSKTFPGIAWAMADQRSK